MSEVESAISRFAKGCSCSQAVLCTYGEKFGLTPELAAKLAVGFGGGLGRTGRTCGAVTGAIMVLGLRYGGADPTDAQAKARVAELVQDLITRFQARAGSSDCRGLLGCEIDTPEKLRAAKEQGLFATVCVKAVRNAAEILEAMLAENDR